MLGARIATLYVAWLLIISPAVAQSAASTSAASGTHDRQYFRDIAAHKFAVPPGASAFSLAPELIAWLASPDPELRDDLAYSILDAWVRDPAQLSNAQLLTLLPQLQQNLSSDIGESGNESVFKRSYSALVLASFAQRDLDKPFLSPTQYRDLLTAAETYLREERDTRGFDVTKGWIHSTAHTADLLAELARNPHFTPEDQQALYAAIEQRLRTAGRIYTYGEQSRLAVALLCILTRVDFNLAYFQKWLESMQQDRAAFKQSPPDITQLALFENHSYLLEALLAHMPVQTPLSPAAAQARDAVRAALRGR